MEKAQFSKELEHITSQLYKPGFWGLGRKVDTQVLNDYRFLNRYESFVLSGENVNPANIDKNNVSHYESYLKMVQNLPSDKTPENVILKKLSGILEKQNFKNNISGRKVIMDSDIEDRKGIQGNYTLLVRNMVDNDKSLGDIIGRLTKTEMTMKTLGFNPDVGWEMLNYGGDMADKLESIVGKNSKKEWNIFSDKVLKVHGKLHNIGIGNVHGERFKDFEERLTRLGLLERKLDKDNTAPERTVIARNFKELHEYYQKNNEGDKPSPPPVGVLLTNSGAQSEIGKDGSTSRFPGGTDKGGPQRGKVAVTATRTPADRTRIEPTTYDRTRIQQTTYDRTRVQQTTNDRPRMQQAVDGRSVIKQTTEGRPEIKRPSYYRDEKNKDQQRTDR